MVRTLISQGVDVHENNEEALRIAVEVPYIEIVALLIRAGADPYITTERGFDSAMEEAQYSGRRDIVILMSVSEEHVRPVPNGTQDWAAAIRQDDGTYYIVPGQTYRVCTNATHPHHYDALYYNEYCRGFPVRCATCPYCRLPMDTTTYTA